MSEQTTPKSDAADVSELPVVDRRPARVRRSAAAVLAMLVALAGVATASPAGAGTYKVVNTGGIGVSARPSPSLAAPRSYGVPEGRSVELNCMAWGDAVGRYANRLWWNITYNGRRFYIPDTYLNTPNRANQPLGGYRFCGAVPAPAPAPAPAPKPVGSSIAGADQAINWMLARRGDISLDGWCLKAVFLAYQAAGRNIGRAPTAYDYWAQRGAAQHRGDVNAPRGALVFWDGTYQGERAGHVGISLGDGRYVSTYDRNGRGIHVARLVGGGKYLGWVAP